MDKIIEPTKEFDFSGLSFTHPISIQGGAYFTKLEYNKKPLYIQTPKSLTKQGFVKNGKKYYCELMFDKNAEVLIQWLENLEEKCHHLMHEKKDDWFDGNLMLSDIESAFHSCIRIYKSGKYYLLRAHIQNSKDDVPMIPIYNEKQGSLAIQDVTAESEVISILDIQGIKFTPRSFQIEIELKQMMVLDNEPIFDNCLIKKSDLFSNQVVDFGIDKLHVEPTVVEMNTGLDNLEEVDTENNKVNKKDINLDELNDVEVNKEVVEVKKDVLDKGNDELVGVSIQFDELAEIEEPSEELTEMDNIEMQSGQPIVLKKPNQVYFELYKEARSKAKQAKKMAILAYLEAKNIKKTYLLENIHDDSDFDAEIDETSESELEGL